MPESCKIILNDLYSGRCRGGVQAPLILGKNRLKKSQKEEKVGLTSKTKPHSATLAQGLDVPLIGMWQEST